MALDVGDRRVGVAISDPTKTLAKPLTVIEREPQEEDFERIAELVREYEVERVIIGYPRSLSGETYWQAKQTESYAIPLANALDVPVSFWDERFSTVTAEKLMREAGQKKERIDAVAAAVILQDFLDAQREEGKK